MPNDVKPAILFVLEYKPVSSDQRLLEFAIADEEKFYSLADSKVVVLEKRLNEIELNGRLDEKTKILTIDGFEIAVAYFRTGYSPDQYPTGKSDYLRFPSYLCQNWL